ncbi:MAG TPA: hypothetical protein VNO26_05680 [Candidatus Limnocylindria bacterium]|nr:hypothetical protein [Candidatus Limnocylindria bacterium]
MTLLLRPEFVNLVLFVPTDPTNTKPDVGPVVLRSMSKPSSWGSPWLSIQSSRIFDEPVTVADKLEGAATPDPVVVLVVEETTVLVVEPGPSVVLVELEVLVVVVAPSGVALATFEYPETTLPRVARTRK